MLRLAGIRWQGGQKRLRQALRGVMHSLCPGMIGAAEQHEERRGNAGNALGQALRRYLNMSHVRLAGNALGQALRRYLNMSHVRLALAAT
jgi:hypothetical protein